MGAATDGLRSVDPATIKARALELGFDLCGIAPAVAHPELGFFQQWLDRGYAGEMQYLHRSADRRADVRAVLPSAQSVIVLGTSYNVDRPYSTDIRTPDAARIARYAWGDDYHVVIEHRLDALIAWLRDQAGESLEARRYVDTGPVQERVYAQHAGIGWIGKNTCLINSELGSWVFLAEIICNLPLPADEPGFDQCGTCTLCIDSCPTGAIVEPRVLDSRRCLSYLTIEVKGSIPEAQRETVGSHAYGCDICQEVCPWNLTLSSRLSTDPAWSPRAGLDGASLLHLWNKKDDELRALLKGSAMKRAGVRRLRRNLAVAIGNLRDPEATAALTAHREPTCEDPLVQEHIAWAQRQLEAV
jgi:epoxyqueuosine reductase